jgi:hypothetical protein
LPDDNVRSLQNAIQFVEETRPAPEPDENATTTNNNQPKETK